MSISQGEAVFQAVNEMLNGEINGKVELTKAQLEEVYARVFLLFKTGQTIHKSNPDEATLLKYIPGLVNNWLRKDKRLNGGVKYEAKNPGSRAGSGDPMVKEMRVLLSTLSDPTQKAQVQEAIDVLAARKAPAPSKLPESLRHLIK